MMREPMDKEQLDKLCDLMLSARFEEFYNNFVKSGEFNERDFQFRVQVDRMFSDILDK